MTTDDNQEPVRVRPAGGHELTLGALLAAIPDEYRDDCEIRLDVQDVSFSIAEAVYFVPTLDDYSNTVWLKPAEHDETVVTAIDRELVELVDAIVNLWLRTNPAA
jgi:hypothetical protein